MGPGLEAMRHAAYPPWPPARDPQGISRAALRRRIFRRRRQFSSDPCCDAGSVLPSFSLISLSPPLPTVRPCGAGGCRTSARPSGPRAPPTGRSPSATPQTLMVRLRERKADVVWLLSFPLLRLLLLVRAAASCCGLLLRPSAAAW